MAKYMDDGGLSHFMSLIKRDTSLTREAEGERSIVTENAAPLPLISLTAYGESVQDGTPSPDSPVYIEAVRPLNYTSMPSVIQVVCEDELIASVATEKSGTTSSGSSAITVTYSSVISKAKADEMLTKTWVDSNELWIQYDVKVSGAAAVPTGNLRGMYTGESGDRVPFGGIKKAEDGSTVHRLYISSDQYIADADNSTSLLNSGAYRNIDSEWHTVLYKLHPQYLSSQPWVENATTTGGFSFTLVPAGTGAATYTTKNLRIFTGHVTLIDLKGHELHGLDDTYRDQMDILADGTVQLTKRTGVITPFDDDLSLYNVNSTRALYLVRGNKAVGPPNATTTPTDCKFTHGVGLNWGATFTPGHYSVVPDNYTTYDGPGNVAVIVDINTNTKSLLQQNYPDLKLIYRLREEFWNTINLNKIDLPKVDDDSVVYVAAEVQPYIDASWWTKAGYSTGKLMLDSRRVHGKLESPYTEVEWVESNGKQFVYLDWKPKIATWGFEADFIIRNAFNTTAGAWNASTNANGYGVMFGTWNSNTVNDIGLGSYNSAGTLRIGAGDVSGHGMITDRTSRQTMKLHGTTFTKPNGSTMTVTRVSETANKPYCNLTIFARHDGIRRSGNGSVLYPSSSRIYSLKFYDSNTLECDLVGAIRKKDGVTGLYDKVARKFYPAPGCTYGNVVGDLGEPSDISSSLDSTIPYLVAYNDVDTRMLRVNAPTLEKLEDGQSIRLTYLYAIGNSYQTTELAGWDDTSNNSNVYIKLTLSDDSETEWIPCYYNAYTHLTTHYYAGSPLLLTYRENVFIGATATSSGTAVMRGFWVDQDYNTNTTANNYSDNVIAGLNGVGRYTLCMRDANDNWTKIVNENNKAGVSDKTAYAGGLRLGKIIYHNSGSDISAGSNTGSMLSSAIAVDLRYSLNGIANAASTTLQFRKPVYLVGTVNATDGLFYLDQTKWWSQELPISDDGKVYVLFGWAYGSYYAAYLSEYNPAYVYKNGHIQELTNGHVVQKDVPANAVFTDTTYSAGTGLSLSGTTFSNSGVTGVKGNSESSYRTGQVNLTADNIGAAHSVNESFNPFAPEINYRIQLDRLDNAFYFADKRWSVTGVKTDANNVETALTAAQVSYLFDSSESNQNNVPAGGKLVVTIDFTGASGTGTYMNYPYGKLYMDFYYTSGPASVAVRVYGKHTGSTSYWQNLTVTADSRNTSARIRYIADQTVMYNMQKLEITVNAKSDTAANLSEIAYYLTRASKDHDMPYVSKLRAETLYYNLTAPKFIGALEGNVTGNVTGNLTGNVTGGTIKGTIENSPIYFDASSCPSFDASPTYLLGIESYANGGRVKYRAASTTTVGNATKATQDGSGNTITSTYTKLSDFNAARSWYAECSTAAATVAKTATISPSTTAFTNDALTPGTVVFVKFSETNSGAVGSLTLSVNNTTAKGIRYIYNGTLSAIPGANYIKAGQMYQFTYDGTYWVVEMNYNTNSTYNLGLNQVYNNLKVKGAIAAESIAVGDSSGYIQAAANVSFDLSYRIVWVTKALTTSSAGSDLYAYEYSSIYDRNLATNHGFSGGTPGRTVYLVGTVSGTTMTLSSPYLTTTQPISVDNKCYVPIGRLGTQSTGANYFFFNGDVVNTVYMYVEGAFRQIDPYISSGLVTGTLPISRGGTGKTTAADAWTALGGGAIGKKASLAASDIPNLSTDKLTSGTLGVARGGTGKATHTSNAVLTGNGTSAVNNVATVSGALYATSANGAPSFGTLPIAQGGTGKTTAADAWTALGGGAIGKKASLAASDIPSHASTATTYGAASTSNYGHAKLSSATDSSSEALAATPKAVKAAYDKASDALAGVATLTSTVTSDYYFKVTYSISNGTITCAAHVYSAGAEVTSTFQDSCFKWYYDIGSGWVSQGTGKTKTVTTLSDFGGNVKCDFTPPES